MKKWLAVMTMAAVMASLTACGSSDSGQTSAAQTQAAAENSADEGAAAGASGEEYPEYNWTAAMTVAETTTNYKMVERFAELLNERSGGKITVDIYPGDSWGTRRNLQRP